MGRLIVLARPGCYVVSGKVIEFSSLSVTIENDVFFSKINGTEKRKLILLSKQVDNLKLKIGAQIIASVKPTEDLSTLSDGAYSKKIITPIVESFVIRYTGAFDFEQYGLEKEEHVFCGNVIDIIPVKRGGNIVLLSLNINGESIKKKLYMSIDNAPKIKKGVFVTGPAKNTSFGTVYSIKSIMKT